MSGSPRSLLGALVALVATAATVSLSAPIAGAEVRVLEAVGTGPIDPTGRASVAPRDAAIDGALREAVVRVAQEFLADRPIDAPDDANDANDANGDGSEQIAELELELIGGENLGRAPDFSDEASDAADEAADLGPDLFDLEAILGKKMVPYTTRFRVVEDRGRQPALFADDPDVSEEYVVIVEVQVDVDRVRAKLVAAGLIPPGEDVAGTSSVRLVVEGLTAYPAYLAIRDLLEGAVGARGVVPVEMRRGEIVFDVETGVSAVELLEKLLSLAPPQMEIIPLAGVGNRVRVAVEWIPEPAAGADLDSEEPQAERPGIAPRLGRH